MQLLDQTPSPSATEPHILLVTGARQVGKSTLLWKAVQLARINGADISGILTRRTGPHDLQVVELRTSLRYMITDPFDEQVEGSARPGAPLSNFRMNAEAMRRSSEALAQAFPSDVVVVDELGPLEFRRRQGWVAAFDLLRTGLFRLAVVVVRPELLGEAVAEFQKTWYRVVNVNLENREALTECLAGEMGAFRIADHNALEEQLR